MLIIYDDLSRQSVAYRQMALLLEGYSEGFRVEAELTMLKCGGARRASDVAMQALAHYLQRAQQAWSEVGMEPAAARKLACSSALEDLLLYLSTYRCMSLHHGAFRTRLRLPHAAAVL